MESDTKKYDTSGEGMVWYSTHNQSVKNLVTFLKRVLKNKLFPSKIVQTLHRCVRYQGTVLVSTTVQQEVLESKLSSIETAAVICTNLFPPPVGMIIVLLVACQIYNYEPSVPCVIAFIPAKKGILCQ